MTKVSQKGHEAIAQGPGRHSGTIAYLKRIARHRATEKRRRKASAAGRRQR